MDADAFVIGGSSVGLGVFTAVSAKGRKTILTERRAAAGRETSNRNNGVLHGGMYYAPIWLKAKLSTGS